MSEHDESGAAPPGPDDEHNEEDDTDSIQANGEPMDPTSGDEQGPGGVREEQEREETPASDAGDDDDESIFDSEGDLEEIFSAMEEVKQEEAKAVVDAMKAIESGEKDMSEALASMSDELAGKIQKQLEERTRKEKESFISEDDFVTIATQKNALEKTWYHCLHYLVFKAEDGIATKQLLYEALKDVLSKSPVDPVPEHMFNFGLSALVKVQLYDKPVVSFKRGTFTLQMKKKTMQSLLEQIGRPLSKRPVVTRKEEKKMITDFFSDDFLG